MHVAVQAGSRGSKRGWRTFFGEEDGDLPGSIEEVVKETEPGLREAVLLLVHGRFVEPEEGLVVAGVGQQAQHERVSCLEHGVRYEVPHQWRSEDRERWEGKHEEKVQPPHHGPDHVQQEAQLGVRHECQRRLSRIRRPAVRHKRADLLDGCGKKEVRGGELLLIRRDEAARPVIEQQAERNRPRDLLEQLLTVFSPPQLAEV